MCQASTQQMLAQSMRNVLSTASSGSIQLQDLTFNVGFGDNKLNLKALLELIRLLGWNLRFIGIFPTLWQQNVSYFTKALKSLKPKGGDSIQMPTNSLKMYVFFD